MFRPDTLIALDIGASKLVVAEFLCQRGAAPELLNYGIGDLGVAPDRDSDVSAYVVSALRDQMRENGIKPGRLNLCVSGQTVFPRFVKLPPVSGDKVIQMIQYEAEQNVPFPIEEVVWDYQILEGETVGELNVMLVAVKIENVMAVTDCVQAAKLEPEIVDAAPMALYNAVRYNYPALQGCTLVLDIGARASNLIFLEGNRVFSRSVPVAGNTITADIAKELDVPFDKAEELKKERGYVALGGVHAGSGDETADRVARIIRNVTTRLHAEVSRSINFYRSQQGGSAPSQVLLTGGSSVLPHLDRFFREKLKAPVEMFNPFVNVTVSSRIPADRVNADMHLLGGVAGLALRGSLKCPVQINLMPPKLVAAKRFRRRQPYFALSAAGLVFLLLCVGGYSHQMKKIRDEQLQEVKSRISRYQRDQVAMDKILKAKDDTAKRSAGILDLAAVKTEWIEIIDAFHRCLLDGMWLTSVKPVLEDGVSIESVEIGVMGFQDALAASEIAGDTAEEIFCARLQQSPMFTEETEVRRMSAMSAASNVRDFTVMAFLRKPIRPCDNP